MAQPVRYRFLNWLAFLVILSLPILPIAFQAMRDPQGVEAIFPPGPLASAHESLACNCCHAEPWRGWRDVVTADRQTGATMDRACAQCHGGLLKNAALIAPLDLRPGFALCPQVVGPHHARQLPDEVGHCAACHAEHQGEKGLRSTEDRCRRCHRDLRTVDGEHTFCARVTAFDTDHPPLGWWRAGGLRDSGSLRFNHQMHLGLDPSSVHGLEEAVVRLRKQACSFCHQPDSSGSYMAPVRYDRHCALCHPLTVPFVVPTNDFRLHQAAEAFRREPAPHAAPVLVQAVMRERFRLLAEQHPLIWREEQAAEPVRSLPGRYPEQPVRQELSGWVNDQAAKILGLLFDAPGGCQYCHIAKKGPRHASGLPDYEPTNLPTRWFPYAKFSHAKHGLMQCSGCHLQANTSSRTNDVLMPSKEHCAHCHHSHKGCRKRARGDCLECHQYHGSG
jgi:hypothetical protein